MSQHAPYTREEWDEVHVVNGMAYVPKDGVLSDEFFKAQAQYLRARDAQIEWKIRHYGKLATALQTRDIHRAIEKNRALRTAIAQAKGEMR